MDKPERTGMAWEDEERLEAWLAGRGDGRALVVVAHPDDEVLGCGALLARLRDVAVLHVTDGAPRGGDDARRHGYPSPAAYAAARAAEARSALALAGVPASHVTCLGLPDQEASLHLGAITAAVAARLPGTALLLTHAFEGGHSDHDAVACAVHAAWAAATPRPLLAEMPFYHAGPEGWRRQHFLPQAGAGAAHGLALTARERDLKDRMAAAHRSQADTLAGFDLGRERVRLAPRYDFARRPHAGDLLYERHGWNLTWPDWVARVRDAATRGTAPA